MTRIAKLTTDLFRGAAYVFVRTHDTAGVSGA